MSDRESWMELIRNEYDPAPSHYRMGDDWDDGAGRIADAILAEQTLLAKQQTTDFSWLIEAPGQRYLAVQRLHMSDNFEWTADHDKALAFRSRDQADALMMAVRQMDRQINGFDKGLFAFEATLGNAVPVEHGWMTTVSRPQRGEK
jgi:hypothetical protein